MKKILLSLLVIFSVNSFSQQRCGTTERTHQVSENNKNFAIAKQKVNNETEKWIENNPNHSLKSIITIPVVVHVVWKSSLQNISDAQILSQIDVLNKDFRRTNVDVINTPSVWQSIASDCEIEFCMATIDPNGIASTGITRTQTTVNSFGMNNDPVKSTSTGGANPWPSDDYLNIWVCKLDNLLGYSTVPSGWNDPGDGVVIGFNYFGTIGTVQSPYHKGRTTTHEIGHWLNLEHTWGSGWSSCGSDQVNDTPTQEWENYGCPAFPEDPNSCSTSNPNGDMFMNYMDYTNDACMNLFTVGQKTRMLSAINQYRPELITQQICGNSVDVENITNIEKEIVKIVDILGREVNEIKNTSLFYIYNDGTVEKKIILE
ncbi:MAG TPA: zinc metalloprotease [Flavobacteriales bacterium]|nr:zinc metalloprotease [Flavobacteriales bacterium]